MTFVYNKFKIAIFRLVFFGFLISVIISCDWNINNRGDSVKVIDIESNIDNFQVLYLSQFAREIQYIPLENCDELPLTGISHIDIKDKRILIDDGKLCLLYDYKGHFISRIGLQGRGPEEYQFITNIKLGNAKSIYLSDLYDLLEYDFDGKLVKRYPGILFIKNENILGSWYLVNDTVIFGRIPNNTGMIHYRAMMVSKSGHIFKTFNNYDQFNRGYVVASGFEDYACIYKYEDVVFYKEFYNDTIFSLSKQYQLNPEYYLKLGRYKEPTEERIKRFQGPIMFKYLFVFDAFQTSNTIFINCWFGNRFPAKRLHPKNFAGMFDTYYNTTEALGIYNKKTGDLVFCKPTSTDNPLFTSGLYNDIDAGPRFFPRLQVNDSIMLMWVDAKELKDHIISKEFIDSNPKYPEKKQELEKLSNNLKETDNPVLVLVRLKK